MKVTADQLAHAMCCSTFVMTLEAAVSRAGGVLKWDELKGRTLEEVMHRLAPNGVGFVHSPGTTVESFKAEADLAAKALPFVRDEPPAG